MNNAGYALTTGASSGIGECFARALAARGENLILTARSEDKLKALASELARSHGIRVEVIPADLSVEGAGSALAERINAKGLSVRWLVNNAGFGARGEFAKIALDRQSAMVRLHLQAMVELAHAFAPAMVQRREGAIINVSSMSGFQPMPYFTIYSATKAFMTSFSMGLAEELRPYGVRVVTLAPGLTRTNFVVEGDAGDRRKIMGKKQSPEEVVNLALRAAERGGGVVVPGWSNRGAVFAERFLPKEFVAKMISRMLRPVTE